MSEEPPKNEAKPIESEDLFARIRQASEAGSKLEEADRADRERGPVVQLVRVVYRAAYKNSLTKGPLFNEFHLFQKSFIEHFGGTEAQRYRLYHIIVGSGPFGDANLFDAEGEWSIATKMRELAKKYNIDIEKV